MCCRVIRREQLDYNDHNDDSKGKKVWKPKVCSQVQAPSAPVNMVFMLPKEFSLDVNEAEEEAPRLLLPQQATFVKPAGNNNLHLKALYLNGFVNGRPTSKMVVDGGAAVKVMPMTTYRKIGKIPAKLIKTDMTFRDYGG